MWSGKGSRGKTKKKEIHSLQEKEAKEKHDGIVCSCQIKRPEEFYDIFFASSFLQSDAYVEYCQKREERKRQAKENQQTQNVAATKSDDDSDHESPAERRDPNKDAKHAWHGESSAGGHEDRSSTGTQPKTTKGRARGNKTRQSVNDIDESRTDTSSLERKGANDNIRIQSKLNQHEGMEASVKVRPDSGYLGRCESPEVLLNHMVISDASLFDENEVHVEGKTNVHWNTEKIAPLNISSDGRRRSQAPPRIVNEEFVEEFTSIADKMKLSISPAPPVTRLAWDDQE